MLRAEPRLPTGETAIIPRIESAIIVTVAVVCLVAVLYFTIVRPRRTRRDSKPPAARHLVNEFPDPVEVLFQAPRQPTPPFAPRVPKTPGEVDIAFPKTVDTGSFARYVPFGDKREVIVRRAAALGHHYGFPLSNRRVAVSGREYELATFQATLSPPVHRPGEPFHPEADAQYHPVYDVLYLPGTEVMIPRSPKGFSDAEVERILKAITVKGAE